MFKFYAGIGIVGVLLIVWAKIKDFFLGKQIVTDEGKVANDDKVIAGQDEKIKSDTEALNDALNKYHSDK